MENGIRDYPVQQYLIVVRASQGINLYCYVLSETSFRKVVDAVHYNHLESWEHFHHMIDPEEVRSMAMLTPGDVKVARMPTVPLSGIMHLVFNRRDL